MEVNKAGRFIKKVIKSRNIKQKELAKEVGCSEQTMSKNLSGATDIKHRKLFLISDFLDLSADDILNAGKTRDTELSKYSKQHIDFMKKCKVPKQPDSNGKTLLDYIVELDDSEKFTYLYWRKRFIDILHNNINFITYLIRKEKYDFLKSEVFSFIHPIEDDEHIIPVPIIRSFEFPIFDHVASPLIGYVERGSLEYNELSIEYKQFIDAVFACENKKILDLLPYKPSITEYKFGDKTDVEKEFPLIFYLALEKDILFIVKYYIDKFPDIVTDTHFAYANEHNSEKCVEYLFNEGHY